MKVGETLNRIKELRKKRGLSLEQLSSELGKQGCYISSSSLSKYERGVRNPKIDNWLALANYFNVSLDYLQGISVYPTTKDFFNSQKFKDYALKAYGDNADAFINFAINSADDIDKQEKIEISYSLKLSRRVIDDLISYSKISQESDSDKDNLKKLFDKMPPNQIFEFMDYITDILKIFLKANNHDMTALSFKKGIKRVVTEYRRETFMNDQS